MNFTRFRKENQKNTDFGGKGVPSTQRCGCGFCAAQGDGCKAARVTEGAGADKAARVNGGQQYRKAPSDAVDGFWGGASVEKRRFWGQKGRAERQKDGAKGAWKGALTCLVNNLL